LNNENFYIPHDIASVYVKLELQWHEAGLENMKEKRRQQRHKFFIHKGMYPLDFS